MQMLLVTCNIDLGCLISWNIRINWLDIRDGKSYLISQVGIALLISPVTIRTFSDEVILKNKGKELV